MTVVAALDGETASPVVRVHVVARSGARELETELAHEQSRWRGEIVDLATAPDWSLVADAFDAKGLVVAHVEASPFAWNKGEQADLSLLLHTLQTLPEDASRAPFIDGILARTPLDVAHAEKQTLLSVFAHGAAPSELLTYDWDASDGRLSGRDSPSASWEARAGASATVHVFGAFGGTTSTTYATAAANTTTGSASVTAFFNNWPTVTSVIASKGRLDVGDQTPCTVSALDPDGDVLAYAWSTTCTGTFDNVALRQPLFTLSALSGTGSCALIATVTDGKGGVTSGSFSVQTTIAPRADLAPQIDSTFRSELGTAPGGTIVFRVQAHDPEGTPLRFSWRSNVGAVGVPTTTATSTTVSWTAPSAWKIPGPPPTITATITDGSGVSTTQPFVVTQQ